MMSSLAVRHYSTWKLISYRLTILTVPFNSNFLPTAYLRSVTRDAGTGRSPLVPLQGDWLASERTGSTAPFWSGRLRGRGIFCNDIW
jgi:hypothetical protein